MKVGEQGEVAESLVEAATEGGDDDDLIWFQINGVLNGEFEVGLVLVARELRQFHASLFHLSSFLLGYRIQIADDEARSHSQREDMACAAIRRDEEIIRAEQGAGGVEIGQLAVGEDDDTRQKNILQAEDV